MDELLKLIVENAKGIADISGKTQLDSYIEERAIKGSDDLSNSLRNVLPELDEREWKQWRAFRQIIGRLKLKSTSLRDDLAIITESSRPADSQSRFYAYLARVDLGEAPSMDELSEDIQLREERPGDWLQLALSQAAPSRFRTEVLKLASKLKATDFAFKLGPLREKYGEHFVDWMTELCLAMPFTEGLELASFLDEEYDCGIHSEVLARHPKIKGNPSPPPTIVVPGIWDDLTPEFKTAILEKHK